MNYTQNGKLDMRYRTNRELVKKARTAKIWLAIIFLLIIVGFVVKTTREANQKFVSPISDDKEYCVPWSTIEQVIDETVDEVINEYKNDKQSSLEPISAPKIKKEANSFIKAKISHYARAYDLNEELVDCIVFRESSYNFQAVGDNGKAIGLGQIWPESWKHLRLAMGKSTADTRTNLDDALETLCWGLANGYHNWWSTYNDCVSQVVKN